MSLKVVNTADGYESASVPGVAEVIGQRVYYREATNTDYLAKSILLPVAPATPSNVIVSWMGIIQTIDKDFYVDGSYVKWDGKNLENVVEPLDEFLITYQ